MCAPFTIPILKALLSDPEIRQHFLDAHYKDFCERPSAARVSHGMVA